VPQAFSTFRTNNFSFFPNAPEHYPALAAKVVVVLAAWSHLETKVGFVFSRLLGAEEEKGIAIYNALSNMGAHTLDQVFDAVAAIALNQEQRDFAQAIRGMTKSVKDQRNPLAHGFWGISPDIPDALLLRSPRESLTATGNLMRRMAPYLDKVVKGEKVDLIPVGLAADEIGEIFVYREKDFLTLHERIIAVHKTWGDFDSYALPPRPFDTIFKEARDRLFGPGEVLTRVNKIRAGRSEPPLTPV
jgi:hypothetical protein